MLLSVYVDSNCSVYLENFTIQDLWTYIFIEGSSITSIYMLDLIFNIYANQGVANEYLETLYKQKKKSFFSHHEYKIIHCISSLMLAIDTWLFILALYSSLQYYKSM